MVLTAAHSYAHAVFRQNADCPWSPANAVHIKHTDGHFEYIPYFSLPANDLTDVIAPQLLLLLRLPQRPRCARCLRNESPLNSPNRLLNLLMPVLIC